MIALNTGHGRLTAWSEPALRASGAFKESAALLARWRRVARDRAPGRADFDLTTLKPAQFGAVAIFEPTPSPADPFDDFRCRLFGVGLVAALGRDVTGRPLRGALDDAAAEQAFATLLRRTLSDAAPLFFTIDGSADLGALLIPVRTHDGALQVMLFSEPRADQRPPHGLDARPLGGDAWRAPATSAAQARGAATAEPSEADAALREQFAVIEDHISDSARIATELKDMAEAFRDLSSAHYLAHVSKRLEQHLLDHPNGPNARTYRALLAKAKGGATGLTAP